MALNTGGVMSSELSLKPSFLSRDTFLFLFLSAEVCSDSSLEVWSSLGVLMTSVAKLGNYLSLSERVLYLPTYWLLNSVNSMAYGAVR